MQPTGLTSNRFKRALSTLAGGIVLLSLAGCSTSHLAIGALVPILDNSKEAALESTDARTFYAATPGNLFLLEGLIRTEPENEALRLSAAMLYFSYAFTFDAPEDEAYASTLYLKGFRHSTTALLRRNKKLAAVWDAPFDEFTRALDQLGEDDLPALVWTVANWAQFISLHLDSTRVLTDIPRVVAVLQRTCEIDGAYFGGLPYIILGSLHAFRPPILGGNPEAARENFDRAIDVSGGKFLLAQYFFARFYTYRIQDADLFEKTLRHVIAQPDDILPAYSLLNTIAKNKAARLLGEKDDLF